MSCRSCQGQQQAYNSSLMPGQEFCSVTKEYPGRGCREREGHACIQSKRLAMSVALAFMHTSEYSGLMHFSEYSELMQALRCMQERKQSDCCTKCYIPETKV